MLKIMNNKRKDVKMNKFSKIVFTLIC